MQLITHRSHLDALPASDLTTHIQQRFAQLSENGSVPAVLVLVEDTDDITGPDYAFVDPRGLLSNLFEEHQPGYPEFSRPYEWASYLPDLQLYEALLLVNNEDGYWIMIPETVVEANSDLHWVLTSNEQGGLSPPQPM